MPAGGHASAGPASIKHSDPALSSMHSQLWAGHWSVASHCREHPLCARPGSPVPTPYMPITSLTLLDSRDQSCPFHRWGYGLERSSPLSRSAKSKRCQPRGRIAEPWASPLGSTLSANPPTAGPPAEGPYALDADLWKTVEQVTALGWTLALVAWQAPVGSVTLSWPSSSHVQSGSRLGVVPWDLGGGEPPLQGLPGWWVESGTGE